MTTIQGKLNSTTFSGIVRFTPDSVFVNYATSPDELVILPIEASIVNGSFTINVPQSQNLSGQPGLTTEGVTYKVEILKLDGSYLQHFFPFHTVVPDTASVVDFTTLISIPRQTPYLDISIYGITNLLTEVPTYRDKISSKFNIRGTYDPAISYVLNDMVEYQGNSYLWRNTSSLAGQTPPLESSNTNWFLLAKKGDTGSGTTAIIVGYNSSTWNNSNQAASRGDVEDAITATQGMIPNTTNFLTKTEGAPKNNPVFTGKVQRDAMTYPVPQADREKEVITASYLETAISNISSNKLTTPIVFARKVNSIGLSLNTRIIVTWDNRIINENTVLDTNGNFTVPEDGTYLVYCKLSFNLRGAYSGNNTRANIRAIFTRSSPSASDYGDLFHENVSTVADDWQFKKDGWLIQTGLKLNEIFQIRVLLEPQQLSGTGSTPLQSSGNSITGTPTSNHFYIWRVN